MINKAIAHITDQMMKLNQPLVQLIEEYLTEICTTEAVAEKLLAEGKTLKELNDRMWSEAAKRKTGQGAYIPEPELYAMAEEYYGIAEEDKQKQHKASDVIDIRDLL